MQSKEKLYEELRKIGNEMRLQKYIDTENLLKGTILGIEAELVKTMSPEQKDIYNHLEGYFWNYIELAEKEAFYHGFQIAKALLSNK